MNLRLRTVCACFALLSLSVFAPLQANAAQLGDATLYNLFVFGNAVISNTDAEGRIAIGGNATLSNFGAASKIGSSTNGSDTEIIGGNLTWANGQLYYGNGKYGGSASLSGVGTPNGTLSQASSSINFSSAKTSLQSQSIYLGALASSGTVANNFGVLTLTGTNATQNTFTLTQAQFQNANTLNINVPTTSTTIINVQGTSVTFFNGQTFINGAADFRNSYNSKLLFNFYQATTLNDTSTGINGSVLAPFADATFGYSQLNGTLVVNSLVSTGELHWLQDPNSPSGNSFQFNGNLPSSTPSNVPEPGAVTLLASMGVVSLQFVRRRSRR